jgi:hypothetical protein
MNKARAMLDRDDTSLNALESTEALPAGRMPAEDAGMRSQSH